MKKAFPVYDICTLSDFKQEDIMVSRFAPYLQVHKNLHMAHKHNFYHLVLFTEGGGTHAIDFQSFLVRPWQIYFMIPGQVHSWSFEGHIDGYVINFSPAFFQSFLVEHDYLTRFPFFSGDVADEVIDLPAEIRENVKEVFEQMLAESAAPTRMGTDMVRVLMLQLFILVARLNPPKQQSQASAYGFTVLKNFQQLIEKNYRELRLPKDYAALLYITPNHLNALCNDLLGISAGELIRRRVALEAKRMLVNMDLTIAEIASNLSFADNSYFSKFFKKQVSLTPEEFRKQITQKNHENVNY
jgi:AraC-like DNA-binding protein